MILQAIALQSVLMITVTIWIARARTHGLIDIFVKAATLIAFVAGLYLAGIWVYPPRWALWIFTLGTLVLFLRSLKRTVADKSSKRAIIFSYLPATLLLPLAGFLIWQGLSGRNLPSGPYAKLASPFASDINACAISAGASPLLNLHNFPSKKPKDIGQHYAIDIVRRDTWGFRTVPSKRWHPKPPEIRDYAMFGTSVFAPCTGEVIHVVDGLVDQPIGGSDRERTSGNGIVLQCDIYHVHLHHFQKHSTRVKTGDRVLKGEPLGRIGNSGNTREPHLHLHAETIVQEGNVDVHGEPVPIKIGGKFLARGDCI